MIGLKQLVEAGVQFGHVTSKRNPNMDPYIWGVKNRVNLIDVSKTALQLERAAQFLRGVAADGGQILWVGTKKVAQGPIREVAEKLRMPYVDHRWVGGTLSNYQQVKKSVTKLLHFEDVVAKADRFPHYTKKEFGSMQKHAGRLEKIVGGIRKMTWPVSAIVLVDVGRTEAALREAVDMGVPVVALVDTNDDPSLVNYPIPANDDAASSVRLIIDHLGAAAIEGQAEAAAKKPKVAEKEEAPAAKKLAAEVVKKPVEGEKKASVATKAPVAKAVAKPAEKKVGEPKVAPKEQAPAADKKVAPTAKPKAPAAKPAEKKTTAATSPAASKKADS